MQSMFGKDIIKALLSCAAAQGGTSTTQNSRKSHTPIVVVVPIDCFQIQANFQMSNLSIVYMSAVNVLCCTTAYSM